ncbi:hypothetical protein LY76DRAFT_5835 [Colletotrichum caudatum]|nr:hypothetical protein LY76DRAFT_5835 [Colletotrichum caudatum]
MSSTHIIPLLPCCYCCRCCMSKSDSGPPPAPIFTVCVRAMHTPPPSLPPSSSPSPARPFAQGAGSKPRLPLRAVRREKRKKKRGAAGVVVRRWPARAEGLGQGGGTGRAVCLAPIRPAIVQLASRPKKKGGREPQMPERRKRELKPFALFLFFGVEAGPMPIAFH